MTALMRWLVPDRALTWEHRPVAWRFDPYDGCHVVTMLAGGLDVGRIEKTP